MIERGKGTVPVFIVPVSDIKRLKIRCGTKPLSLTSHHAVARTESTPCLAQGAVQPQAEVAQKFWNWESSGSFVKRFVDLFVDL